MEILKPKKGFVQEQLKIENLTGNQWDGIMRAMDKYAEHYHSIKIKEMERRGIITIPTQPTTTN